MRIPTLAMTLAAAGVVVLPMAANAVTPTAGDDSATTTTGIAETINVMANDSNPDADEPFFVSSNTEAANGTVACDEVACTYTPDTGWDGIDTFTYTVSDGGTEPETATATVTVETVDVRSITNASTPTTNLTWPDKTSPSDVVTPPSATFVGVVKKAGGVVAQGVDVQLMEKPTGADGYTAVEGATDTSNQNGRVSVSGISPTSFTVYKWKAGNFMGQLSTLGVTPSLTGKVSKGNLAVGDTFTVSGTSGPAAEGATVVLQRRNPTTDRWENVGEPGALGNFDENLYGEYSFEMEPEASGSYVYRVKLPENATAGLNGAKTGQLTVKRYDAKIMEVHPQDADEYVIVKNNGSVALNLKDWTLTQGIKSVTIPRWTLGKGDTVVIHSGKGRNKGRHLYLKGADRWAASGTLTLTDKREIEMFEVTYP